MLSENVRKRSSLKEGEGEGEVVATTPKSRKYFHLIPSTWAAHTRTLRKKWKNFYLIF